MKKTILINTYLYRLKRENKSDSLIDVGTFKWCTRTIIFKNSVIIKRNGEDHNHDLQLLENVQIVYSRLNR